jgi:type IV pilus assembly protein PilZ
MGDTPPASESGTADAPDRRSVDRSAITLRVDYKRLNTFFADYTKNISKGGTFIRTSKPLEIGTEFVFVLSFPSAEGQLRLRGEVMWVVAEAEAKGDSPAGMGIRFLFDHDAERASVHRFVERLMTDALGAHIASKLIASQDAQASDASRESGDPSSAPPTPPTRRPG